MGFAFRPGPAFSTASPWQPGDVDCGQPVGLPSDVAFLRDFGIDEHVLAVAARDARRTGASASAVLIADGGVTDTLFFFTLARHLGLPFVWGRPPFRGDTDPVVALRTGRARLADGSWLIAPGDAARRVLLAGRARDVELPNLSITTPARFATLVCEAFPHAVAASASAALPDAAPHLSARGVGWRIPAAVVAAACGALLAAAGARGLADAFGLLFAAGMVFRLLVTAAGMADEPAAETDLSDRATPTYSVLVPLYREASMVPGLVANLEALVYPRAKLEILFLTEADDGATRAALQAASLPRHMRVIIVPDGQPRTKPRALNVGLTLAKGELVTVYDAEDRPQPDQLRAAALRFRRGPADLACLQARLAIGTRGGNRLVRLFAIEYAALFDFFNVGAARCGLPIALGGTSNHFRAAILRRVGGWDAFNVTEDADLGLRLARFGYAIGDLPSTTAESAEASLKRWFDQRRRWTKGWMQTALVLLRDNRAARAFGCRRWLVVLLLLTNLVVGPLLTPLALMGVVAQVALAGLPDPHNPLELAEATLAVSVFALGIIGPVWCGVVAMRRRALAGRALAATIPFYQLMICIAAWGGLVDLLRRPYHWRKTPHTAPALIRSSP